MSLFRSKGRSGSREDEQLKQRRLWNLIRIQRYRYREKSSLIDCHAYHEFPLQFAEDPMLDKCLASSITLIVDIQSRQTQYQRKRRNKTRNDMVETEVTRSARAVLVSRTITRDLPYIPAPYATSTFSPQDYWVSSCWCCFYARTACVRHG